MIKKIIVSCTFLVILLVNMSTYATEVNTNETYIPSISMDELLIMMQSKQAKVDIIKKNNIEIENLKTELKEKIVDAAEKINYLKIDVSQEKVEITDEVLIITILTGF